MTVSDRFKAFFHSRTISVTSLGRTPQSLESRPWRQLILAAGLAGVLLLSGGGLAHADGFEPGGAAPSVATDSLTVAPIAKPADEAVPDLDAYKQTKYSDYLNGLQARFGTAAGHEMPIFYLDSDKAAMERMLLMARDDPKSGVGPLSIQVLNQTGGYMLGSILTSNRDALEQHQAHSQRLSNGRYVFIDDKTIKSVCVIVPSDPDMTAQAKLASYMGIDGRTFADLPNNPFNLKITRKQTQVFTDYHETAHCLDKFYIPQFNGRNEPEQYFHRAQGEAYADAVASLLMAQEGDLAYAGQIAKVRAIGSMRNGPAFAQDANASGWDQFAGAVYYNAPALMAVQMKINSLGAEGLARLSQDDILKLAHEIVEKDGMNIRQFKDLYAYHKLGAKFRDQLDWVVRKGETDALRDEAVKRLEFLDSYDLVTQNAWQEIVGERSLAPGRALPRSYEYRRTATLNWDEILKDSQANGGDFKALSEAIARFRDLKRETLNLMDPVLPFTQAPTVPHSEAPALPLPQPPALQPAKSLAKPDRVPPPVAF